MAKKNANTLTVEGTDIRIIQQNEYDYISLTDIAKRFNADNPSILIINWLSTGFAPAIRLIFWAFGKN
jgi:hypothetical protein